MKSEKCLIGVLVLLCCTFAFSDIITGTVIDSITNVPIGQVWVGNSAGDFTYTAANGTFTLSTTTNITILKNVVQDQKDKIIQIRSIRGELLSQFTSAMLNPYLLAKGIYIVTEKEENQEPFSYKIVVISATSISNLFARANLKSNASRTLSKTRSIASTNILTFTRNGYITIHRTVTGSLSGMVVRMQIGTPDSAPDLVFPENTAMNVSTMPTLLWSSVSGGNDISHSIIDNLYFCEHGI